ncbi:MAG: HNH endonuclease [Actinomycetia bacterium]|nr:HNH endonuclease [Actinomycetes bacterium]
MSTSAEPFPASELHALVRADLAVIDAAQDRLRSTCTDLAGNAFRIEVAERLEKQQRTNRGLSYRMFGEVAAPVDSHEDPRLPAGVKMRDLLGARLHLTRGEVTRRFRIAARIRPRRSLTGPPLPPELPALATAVQAGEVGEDHIAAVCRGLDALPAAVSAADRDAAERTLVRHAREQDAKFVEAIGTTIADCLNPDGNFTDEDRARRRGLVLGKQRPDGMSRLSGWLDPEARAYVEAVTAAIRPGRHLPRGDGDAGSGQRDNRSAEQRCHDGVKLGLSAAMASGGLGKHRGLPVTVIATTTLAELDQAARAVDDPGVPMPAPARTGGTGRLPMRDLIRMAAGSVHYLLVFEDHSDRPLYLGRSKRIATADHRIVCYGRDGGCTKPNCFEPGYHSEVHHARGWQAGGTTDADNLYFGCPADHAAVTDGEYTTSVTDGGRIAWDDGTGPPRVNRVHHPEELLDDESG